MQWSFAFSQCLLRTPGRGDKRRGRKLHGVCAATFLINVDKVQRGKSRRHRGIIQKPSGRAHINYKVLPSGDAPVCISSFFFFFVYYVSARPRELEKTIALWANTRARKWKQSRYTPRSSNARREALRRVCRPLIFYHRDIVCPRNSLWEIREKIINLSLK